MEQLEEVEDLETEREVARFYCWRRERLVDGEPVRVPVSTAAGDVPAKNRMAHVRKHERYKRFDDASDR